MTPPDWRSLVQNYAHYGVLLVVFLFMFWVRIRPADRVLTDSGVQFSGNDPWYHARIVQYTVRHFPSTPNFDPFSYFPYGTGRHSGFGGLFDQLIALAALVLGGGSPQTEFIAVVTAYAPAVFGALTIVPAYLIGRWITDRWGGVVVTVLLALVGGQFLSRTVIGVADHQSAESFFAALAVAGFLYSVQTAYTEKPTEADVRDRNWFALRRPIIAGVAGGLAIASYLMTWPPGVMVAFTLGIFAVVQLLRDHARGRSTEYLAFGIAVPMLVATVLTLLYAKSYILGPTAFSLLQPVVVFGIGAGTLALATVSRYMDREGYSPAHFTAAAVGLITAVSVVGAVAVPRTVELVTGLVTRIYSFGLLTSPEAGTVAEIQPGSLAAIGWAYAGLSILAIVGFLALAARVIQEDRPIDLVIILWSLTITSAYFTMARFGYYLAVNVAVLAGFTVWWIAHAFDLPNISDVDDIETYQILVILIVAIAIVPGNVVAVGGTSPPVWESAEGLSGSNQAWQNELTWVRENTPPIPMDYYGRYPRPDSDDFAYPDGAYGIMSWWDYGHWITYTGQRIPDANPFQEGPRTASAFLLAQTEPRAELVLEALSSSEVKREIPQMTDAELRATIEAQSPQRAGEDTRYVMIDDQMAAGKFSAIATWSGPPPSSYFSRQEFEVGTTRARLVGPSERYHRTMLARLYFRDANGLSHYRLVHETNRTTPIVSIARQTPSGFQTTNFVNRRLSREVFTTVQQRPDLSFYAIMQDSSGSSPASVKTFERVSGATLTGQVDAGNQTTVIATLDLQTNTGRNFTYVQTVRTDQRGAFEMTVPYATTNDVEPAKGGTDTGVTALGSYELVAGSAARPSALGETVVPESAIYEGRTITVEFEPVEAVRNESDGSNATVESGQTARWMAPTVHLRSDLTPTVGRAISGGWSALASDARRLADV